MFRQETESFFFLFTNYFRGWKRWKISRTFRDAIALSFKLIASNSPMISFWTAGSAVFCASVVAAGAERVVWKNKMMKLVTVASLERAKRARMPTFHASPKGHKGSSLSRCTHFQCLSFFPLGLISLFSLQNTKFTGKFEDVS